MKELGAVLLKLIVMVGVGSCSLGIIWEIVTRHFENVRDNLKDAGMSKIDALIGAKHEAYKLAIILVIGYIGLIVFTYRQLYC